MVTVGYHLFGQCWEVSVDRVSGRILDCRLEYEEPTYLPLSFVGPLGQVGNSPTAVRGHKSTR